MASKFARAVGGNWNTDATWSTTSGGAADTVKPTAADDVFLDASSGNVTIDAASVCRSITCTGYTGTLTHNAFTLSIGDATAGASSNALIFVAGMTYTLANAITSAIDFVSTSSTAQNVNFSSKTSGNVSFSGSGGSWKLTGTHNTGATATVTHTRGTLDVNGQTCSYGFFDTSNANTRTLTLGAAAITLTATTGTPWNAATVTNLTLNANTSTISMSAGTFAGGGKTYNNLTITGSNNITISGANTFNNITWSATSASIVALPLANDQIVTGTLTLTGNNSATLAGQIYVISSGFPSSQASPRTITAAAVALTRVVFSDIVGAGAASWSGTEIGDAGGNSGITFTTPKTAYWVSTAANIQTLNRWASTSGGAGGSSSYPLPQDTCVFDANSFTAAGGTFTPARINPPLDLTGAANTVTFSNGLNPAHIYGDFKLKTGSTTSGNGQLVLIGRGTHTINMNGVSFTSTLATVLQTFCMGGSYTLASDISIPSTGTLAHSGGTFDAAGFNLSMGAFSSNNTLTRTVTMGSGTWTLTGINTVFNTSTVTNLTLTGSSADILITDTSATGKTFDGRSRTYKSLTITGGGSGFIQLPGSSAAFTTLTINAPKTVRLSTTGTLTVGTLIITGSVGNIITLVSTTGGTLGSLILTNTSTASYCSFQDVNANAASSIWATDGTNTDAGNNHNVIFAQPKRLSVSGAG